VRDIKALNDDAKLRDRTDAPHESIGGVSVDVGEVGGAYRRPVRIDVDGAMRHLRKVTFVSNLPKELGDIPA
jgi:hypothetical protein